MGELTLLRCLHWVVSLDRATRPGEYPSDTPQRRTPHRTNPDIPKILARDRPPGFFARVVYGQMRNAAFAATKLLGFHVSPEWVSQTKATSMRGGQA